MKAESPQLAYLGGKLHILHRMHCAGKLIRTGNHVVARGTRHL